MILGDFVEICGNSIVVPTHLLRPIGLEVDWKVRAFYYPPPEDTAGCRLPGYEHVCLRHDLIISPFKTEFWPFLGGMEIALADRAQALRQVAAILADSKDGIGANLLTANVARFGHRYVQWRVALDLVSLRRQNHDLDDEVPSKVLRLLRKGTEYLRRENDKRKESDRFLHDFDEQKTGLKTLRAWHLYDHWRHDKRIRNSRPGGQRQRLKAEQSPIPGKVESFGIELEECGQWEELLEQLGVRSQETVGALASVDTHSFLLRFALIPPKEWPRFRYVILSYTQSARYGAEAKTTRGLLVEILDAVSPHNLWQIRNCTNIIRATKEVGRIEFLVEAAPSSISFDEVFEELRARIHALSYQKPSQNVEYKLEMLHFEEWLGRLAQERQKQALVSQPRESEQEGEAVSDFKQIGHRSTQIQAARDVHYHQGPGDGSPAAAVAQLEELGAKVAELEALVASSLRQSDERAAAVAEATLSEIQTAVDEQAEPGGLRRLFESLGPILRGVEGAERILQRCIDMLT